MKNRIDNLTNRKGNFDNLKFLPVGEPRNLRFMKNKQQLLQEKKIEEIKNELLDKIEEYFPKIKSNGKNKGRGEASVIVGIALARFSQAFKEIEDSKGCIHKDCIHCYADLANKGGLPR